MDIHCLFCAAGIKKKQYGVISVSLFLLCFICHRKALFIVTNIRTTVLQSMQTSTTILFTPGHSMPLVLRIRDIDLEHHYPCKNADVIKPVQKRIE